MLRTNSLLGIPVAIFLTINNVCAADYTGQISDYWGGTTEYIQGDFPLTRPWLTMSSDPTKWVRMTRVFSGVGSAMKAVNYGGNLNQAVFLRTSVLKNGAEVMDSINLQNTQFGNPGSIPRTLTVWNIKPSAGMPGAELVTFEWKGSLYRLVDSSMVSVAASALTGLKNTELTSGTVYVFNSATGKFTGIQNTVLEITVRQ